MPARTTTTGAVKASFCAAVAASPPWVAPSGGLQLEFAAARSMRNNCSFHAEQFDFVSFWFVSSRRTADARGRGQRRVSHAGRAGARRVRSFIAGVRRCCAPLMLFPPQILISAIGLLLVVVIGASVASNVLRPAKAKKTP